ncbi:LAQU0S19e00606g1_1 [Lachancea quebecensis]|uniref:LAQU0S19e00606g1_1 n=1 Tax=Lachancea quebecensis TaxID=1654605 RepID=A0A0N7MMC8_9SACH|nr:LAQU0S19e00606g1_1 [Lachancea quebecensis]
MTQVIEVPLVSTAKTQFLACVETEDSKYTSFSLTTRPNEHGDASFDSQLTRGHMDILIVDSIRSGTGRDSRNNFGENILKPLFTSLGIPHQVLRTRDSDSAAQLGHTLRPCSQNTIIIFLSGDTTISEFLNSLNRNTFAGSRPTLSLLPLPLGTGNAWANSLGLCCPATSLSGFLQGKLAHQSFPLYQATFPNGFEMIFFIVLSVGFHANLLHLCSQQRFQSLGVERFRIASQEIFQSYSLKYRLCVSGLPTRDYAYFALINTPDLESSYKPSPQSDPLRSQLHVLGYSSNLQQQALINEIMKGYSNQAGDNIHGDGVTYVPYDHALDVTFDQVPENVSNNYYEICCDGHLLNMLSLQPENHEFDGRICIRFLKDFSSFKLKVMTPCNGLYDF